MKTAYYFPHDSNSRTDEKIIHLLSVLGWTGYGIYWAIVEKLHESSDGWLDCEYERIAFDLRANNDTIKQILHDFKLFKHHKNRFTSQRVIKNLEGRRSRSENAKRAINYRWNKPLTENTNVLPPNNESNTIKERKGKEIKGNEIRESKDLALNKKKLSSPHEIPVHQTFVNKFSEFYQQLAGCKYKTDKSDFVIASRLVKDFGIEVLTQKVGILFKACESRSIWFTKNGYADFSIQNLSRHWNELILETAMSKEDKANADLIKRLEEMEERDARVKSQIES